MKRSVVILLCCAFVPSLAQVKKGKQEKTTKPIVFSIKGEPVTANEFIYLYKKNHQNKSEDFTNEKIHEYLDLYINFKLKVAEASARGMDTTAAFRKEYNSYKDELRKPYLPDAHLIDSLVKLTYERMREEIDASHILINVKPEAQPEDTLRAYSKILDIKNKALAGQDFGNLAAEYSEDPSAKVNKGNLGYFTAMQMVYPFETTAYKTSVGQIGGPVRTRFGYHIIKVMDRKPARGEVEVSHIMMRTGDGKDNQKARNTIFDVYDQLRGGVKWEELCKQYSEDPGSKENGGRLRAFGVRGMGGVPEFEQVALALKNPGDISDPFQTQYGWHIVRLEKKIPFPVFDDLSASLKNKVSRDERTQISKQALQEKLRKEFQLEEKILIKSKVLSSADTSLRKGKWNPPVSTRADRQILFSLQDKGYTVEGFISYVLKNQKANGLSSEKYLDQLYNKYIDEIIIQLLEEKIIKDHPDYKFLLKEYYEGILLFEIMEKEVWNKATEDTVGQRAFYELHASHYQAKERLRANLYSSSSKELLPVLKELMEKGDSVKARDFINANKIREENSAFERGEKAALNNVAWSKGLYLTENNGMYYLAQILNILPPGAKTFEEARAAVISDYQNDLEKSWLVQLRKKYAVKVNEKGKQYILDSLQKN